MCQKVVFFAPHGADVIFDDLNVSRIPDIAFIAVAGNDATGFLQAQLSREMATQPTPSWALAGWHDARGRVVALFRALRRAPEDWLLIVDSSLATSTLQRLQMYVLRSSVTLGTLGDWEGIAIIGPSTEFLVSRGVALDDEQGAVAHSGECYWMRIANRLVHVVGRAQYLRTLEADITAEPALATRAEISLGLPSVSATTAASYVPQMLNLDELGAITFDKGCFPGQEVIARTQNLGSVKRRARAFHVDVSLVEPGSAIVDGGGRRVGDVIRSAPTDGGSDLLAVVRLAALAGPLHVDSVDSPSLVELPRDLPVKPRA